jgi:PAS domain S-box-containing protein
MTADEQIKESGQDYRRLLEAIPDAVVVYDMQGKVVYVNDIFEATYGWRQDELIGRHIDFVPPGELECTRHALDRTIGGEKVFLETRRFTKDGRLVDSQISSALLHEWDGADTAMIVIHRDITEVKQAGQELKRYRNHLEELVELRTRELRESEERYRLLLDSSPDPISVYDHHGKITYLNAAFEQTFGWTLEELAGQGIDFVPSHEVEKTRKAVLRTLKGENVLLETQRLTKEGHLLDIQLKTAIFRDPKGNLAGDIVIYRDISDLKRAEYELKKAKEAAEAANRSKSVFLANMSHELRTPLNAILGFSRLMWLDTAISSAHRERLGIINRSGEHLLALINDVLEMSKIEAGRIALKYQSFDLRHTLRDLEAMIRPPAEGKGLQVHTICASDLPRYIKTDPHKLRQVLINLLDNAVKFTDRGTIVMDVSVAMQNARQTICFEVRDSGAGMAPEEIETIFNAFVRTHSADQGVSGTGLGLSISRRFAQLMGGDISVESHLGQGSVFRYWIPVEPPDMDQIPSAGQTLRVLRMEAGQPDFRILVVEDNFENRTLLGTLLRQAGFEVREAVDGQDGLNQFIRWQPHLIFMDMRMPVMDGFEATSRIKAHPKGPDTCVVAVTAHALEEERMTIKAAGCDDFLAKPFLDTELFEILNRHLGVRFVYRDQAVDGGSQNFDRPPVDPSELAALPVEWIHSLSQAAEMLDTEAVNCVIDQVRTLNAAMADALSALAKAFRFDKLQQLLGCAGKKDD